MTSPRTFLIYGANGYTGALLAEEAARRGLPAILAGRREDAVRPLAERLGLPWRAFALADGAAVAAELRAAGVAAVLHAAGPFIHTSGPMVEGCLASGVHYLDITGEIAVFEACAARARDAARAGIVLLPGVGFDVVPSDCLAAALAHALPGATELDLAIASEGSLSRGTTRTMLEGAPQGGAVRRGGKIVRVPLAWQTAEIPFRDRTRSAVTIPWGDVSTAFHSTRIPDITVYMATPPRMAKVARLARPLLPLLGRRPVQRLVGAIVDRTVRGSDAEMRERGRAHLWGRVRGGGREVTGTLETPEGYRLTVLAGLECTTRLLAGDVPPGYHTPSTAFGADLVRAIPGCDLQIDEPLPRDAPATS